MEVKMPKTRPDKSITLEESGLTLTMTYVVMNDVLRFVGSIEEALTSVMTNQEVRDLIIRRLLTNNKKPIDNLDDLIKLEDVEVDIFELDDLLAWVMDHVTYFFMRMADKISKSAEKYPEVMEQMKMSSDPSETGLKASPTSNKSAGPTE